MELYNLIPLSISGEPDVGGTYNYIVDILPPLKIGAMASSYGKRARQTNITYTHKALDFLLIAGKKGLEFSDCGFIHL